MNIFPTFFFWKYTNIGLLRNESYYTTLHLPECCCIWSNLLCQSTTCLTCVPGSIAVARKYMASPPRRVILNTSIPFTCQETLELQFIIYLWLLDWGFSILSKQALIQTLVLTLILMNLYQTRSGTYLETNSEDDSWRRYCIYSNKCPCSNKRPLPDFAP